MTIIAQLIHSLSWLSARNPGWSTLARRADAKVAVHAAVQTATAEKVQLIGDGIKLPRRLDATCYQEVLRAVQETYSLSGPDLVLDLSEVEQIELSGLFALHCIALIMRGETPPDPAYGWRALRAAAERNMAAGRQEHLKLVNPSVQVEALLRANHLDRCLIIEHRNDPGPRLSQRP